jgi:type VI secretion system secreted protein VgrG
MPFTYNIQIGGEDYNNRFESLLIKQSVGWHHDFELRLRLREDAAKFKGILKDTAEKTIGKKMSASFGDAKFEGIITGASLSRTRQEENEVILRGHSPTIVADNGPFTRSFTDQSISQIIEKVLSDHSGSLPASVAPVNKKKMRFAVQYKESDFHFVCRMGERLGEWVFYDGENFHFGLPKGGEALELDYEKDIIHMDLSVKTMPLKFKFKAYDYETHRDIEKEGVYSGALNPLVKIAKDKSDSSIFKGKPEQTLHLDIDDDELKDFANRRTEAFLNETVFLSASSSVTGLKIGQTINIVDKRSELSGGSEDYGSYIITHITHNFDQGKNYSNHFEATPVDPASPPLSSPVHPPFCETQLAEVVENNDTKGLGRVKVQFLWQKGTSEKSPWIRVASPYSGKDKGFFIIPEKGDQVLVAFEQNDPEAPYVLTGMYNGDAKPEHTHHENNKKALKTRGGIEILMNDEKGKETFAIKSPMDVTINAVGGKITLTAKGDIIIQSSSGNITISAPNKIKMEAADIILEAKSSIILKAMKITEKADVSVNIEATQLALEGKATASLKGAMVEVNGSGMTNIQGGMIKLN